MSDRQPLVSRSNDIEEEEEEVDEIVLVK